MLTTSTTNRQYNASTDDTFNNEMTSNQSPCDSFVGLSPPPPPPPPVPPVFNNNSNNTNSLNKTLLPQQEVNIVVNRANVTEIQARSVPTMLMIGNNIWTRRVIPNLRIQQTVFDQHYGESQPTMIGHYRRASLTTTCTGGGGGLGVINDDGPLSFVLLDATSKMLYDVPMRHLLQLVKKDHDDDASIDHVIRAIDEAHMKSEWLDAVTALNKQFDKRPEDKARVLAHKGSTNGLVLIEQFFVKLVRVPAYEFKLIYLKFREEAPTQLERINKHINDLLEAIQVILNNEQLPGILHLLCLLYNSIAGKTIPGLHFDSLLSVLSTRTPKQNTTIAHVLCHLLDEQYSTLLNIFNNQILLKLKDLSSIKYIPIYIDIRLLYTRYKQLNTTLKELQQQLVLIPEHIKTTLIDLQSVFTKLFDYENKLKTYEKDLSNYFCVWDLSIETCFSTLGQFIDKIRLAHMQNVEQRRRNQLLLKQQQRSYENRISQSSTMSRLLRNSQNQYGSDTNIFRDHLNVPLTPTATTIRQRYRINKISREHFCGSSRDISYTNDDEQQQQQESTESTTIKPVRTQNLLSNVIPRKRVHSPIPKSVLTKRPFNTLPICATTMKQDQQSDNVFISSTLNNEQENDHDIKIDYSIDSTVEEINVHDQTMNDDHLLPSNESSTSCHVSICEIQPSFYLTTPVRRLFDFSNDQSTPYDTMECNNNVNSPNNDNSIKTSLIDIRKHPNDFNHSNESNKENSHCLSPTSNENQDTTELSGLPNSVDEDSQQSSSSSLPVDSSNDENRRPPRITSLLSDTETLDEGFETQSNVSETVEPISRSCPFGTNSNERKSVSADETLADEFSRRLIFNSTRRLSHDSHIRDNNSRRASLFNSRSGSLLKTSKSAYNNSTFLSNGQQNQSNKTFTKRTPSAESLGLISTNNNGINGIRSNRHIQRCAVSRRIWNEKDTDETSKSLITSPPSSLPSSSMSQTTIESDEVSSSSTVTTTTTTTTTMTRTTMTNHRLSSVKSKNKIRHLQSLTNTPTRCNSPIIRPVSSRLGHANSCQNVSTTTVNSPRTSSSTKTRSPSNIFLHNSQILRSSFTRTTDKPLRAFHVSTTTNSESFLSHRSSLRTRRFVGSGNDVESTAISSPRYVRKPPSSWHHSKSLTNKALTTVLPSSNLNPNRKASTSTIDLHKANSINSSTFQRLTQSRQL